MAPYGAAAQETFPVNGVQDERRITYVFLNATLHADYRTVTDSGMLVISDGRVQYAGPAKAVPRGAVRINLAGRHIYPSFIDLSSGYGLPEPEKPQLPRRREPQFLSGKRGPFSWNEALRPEAHAAESFAVDTAAAEKLRAAGFGAVMTHHRDGIARGTAAFVTLGEGHPQEEVVSGRMAACYSFNKGTSTQNYPGSQMGCIALLRQAYLDGEWYAASKQKEFNRSLEAWQAQRHLPKWFEAADKLSVLRAAAVAREFGERYIIRGGGDGYQRSHEIAAAGLSLIIPVNFPEPWDLSDPDDALHISLRDLMHWEQAPSNAASLSGAGVEIGFTADGLKEPGNFLEKVRVAISRGLSEEDALRAMTATPAGLAGMEAHVGSLKSGMMANFLVTSGPLFDKETVILDNWVRGRRYPVHRAPGTDLRGTYRLVIGDKPPFHLEIKGTPAKPKGFTGPDSATADVTIAFETGRYLLRFELGDSLHQGAYRLAGNLQNDSTGAMRGQAIMPGGEITGWYSEFVKPFAQEPDTSEGGQQETGPLSYPLGAYGFREFPKPVDVLFRNATVWTGEAEGVLQGADVLVRNGRIAGLGDSLAAGPGTEVVDASGLHLTAGIVDEHSHIAVSGPVNECTQAVTAEVRIGDVVDCDDIHIYRQLAGGVTASHLLHGSCNPVGGQSQLIKMRWGLAPEEMKFRRWPGYIKFALGENVKQSNWGDHQRTRFPQTRMGVERVYMDAFTRAKEYTRNWNKWNAGGRERRGMKRPRRDLELEALGEIIDGKRFITCHSYRQSEINMLMHVADSFGFTVQTFTHILEGYKVADKMKAHGAGGSTFSDWWAYKFEVYEAIPYNGALMHDAGVTVAFNSDDPEMARRLNQEAAKAVRYGGISEADAWNFVTLNPAKLLQVDNRVGSIKTGKDADIVLWTGNPLSVYSKVVQTYVDGVLYYDEKRDRQERAFIAEERARLIDKMLSAGKDGNTRNAEPEKIIIKHCMDEEEAYD